MGYIAAGKHVYGNFELKLLSVTCASSNEKIVYLYMRHQFHYFKKMGRPYHESIDGIADATGLGRATVTRCIVGLEKIKWLTKRTTRTKMGHNQTVYEIHNWNEERSNELRTSTE